MRRSPLTATAVLLTGVVLTLFGCAPVTGTPLLVILGLGGVVAGSAMIVLAAPPRPATEGVADPCQWADHAGCLDTPDCRCLCHHERVELRLPSL